jgi:hypothetical protein
LPLKQGRSGGLGVAASGAAPQISIVTNNHADAKVSTQQRVYDNSGVTIESWLIRSNRRWRNTPAVQAHG